MKTDNPTLLVLRFSAMGDVAMVASVLREFADQHYGVRIIMVSRAAFGPFFDDIPNLIFHPADLNDRHRGIGGLYRLFRELVAYRPDAVADLHFSLRSRFLSILFRTEGIVLRYIEKGNREKKALTRPHNKVLKPLKPTVERYADVFRRLGFPLTLTHTLNPTRRPLPETVKRLFANDHVCKIGIAPFAQHAAKVYPADRMEQVIAYLSQRGHTVLIFGGGREEQRAAETWQHRYANVHSLIGAYTLQQELAIISRLDYMLSMDSAGMHMASLMGVRVFSIWGGTHPYAGFLGYGQRIEDCIQVDHPARPSSVYGNKPCLCDGREAMELISPELIIEKLRKEGI